MENVNRVFIVAILCALLVLPTFASAETGSGAGVGMQPGMGMQYGMGPGRGPGPGWASNLNLTPDQMQKLEAIHMNFFKDTIPQRNQLMLARMELRSLWSQPNPDAAAILAKQKQINGLRDQIMETAIKYRLEARKVFTPDQLAKIQAMRGSFGHGLGRWHHKMGGGGCGSGMGHRGMGGGYGMGPYGRGCPCGFGQM